MHDDHHTTTHHHTTHDATDDVRDILVIGATGKTGSRVAQRLQALQLPVRPASRSSDTYFDWNDPGSWPEALDGAGATYITYYPDLALPGAAEAVRSFVDVGLAHGVRRHVLLTGRGEPGAQRAERLLVESGADWTILRCGFFAQNFSETFGDAIQQGVLAMPDGAGPDPFVDLDDVADVAVAALTEPGHVGRVHELTGPRVVSLHEAADVLTIVTGRPVTYVPLPPEDFAQELVVAGVPADAATRLTEVIVLALDGRNRGVTDDIERVLGRAARDFSTYARDAAASGAWGLSPVPAA